MEHYIKAGIADSIVAFRSFQDALWFQVQLENKAAEMEYHYPRQNSS